MTLLWWCGLLGRLYSFRLVSTSGVHHLLEWVVTLFWVTCMSRILMRVDSIYSASLSMSFLELSFPLQGRPATAQCQSGHVSFLFLSGRGLTLQPVTSLLVPIPLTVSCSFAKSHTITLRSEGIESSPSTIYVSSSPIPKGVKVGSMMEVVFPLVSLVAFLGSLLRISFCPSI